MKSTYRLRDKTTSKIIKQYILPENSENICYMKCLCHRRNPKTN